MNERCLASEIQCFFCAALKGLFYASLSGRSFTLGSHSDLFPFLVRSFLAFLVGRWVTVLVRGSCLTGGLLTVLVREWVRSGSFVTFFESRWESVFADSFLGGASWWRSAWVLSAWVCIPCGSVSLFVLTLFVVSVLDAIWRVGSLVVVAIWRVGSLVVVVLVVPVFSGMFCVCVSLSRADLSTLSAFW